MVGRERSRGTASCYASHHRCLAVFGGGGEIATIVCDACLTSRGGEEGARMLGGGGTIKQASDCIVLGVFTGTRQG